jgi:hypothetical protein
MQRLIHNIAVSPERRFAGFKTPRDFIFRLEKRLLLCNMRYYFKVPYSPSGSMKILNSMFENISSYKIRLSSTFTNCTITTSQAYYFTATSTS